MLFRTNSTPTWSWTCPSRKSISWISNRSAQPKRYSTAIWLNCRPNSIGHMLKESETRVQTSLPHNHHITIATPLTSKATIIKMDRLKEGFSRLITKAIYCRKCRKFQKDLLLAACQVRANKLILSNSLCNNFQGWIKIIWRTIKL